MEIVTVEKGAVEKAADAFGHFVNRINELCARHNKRLSDWLNNEEVCQLLNISKRTLQTYRSTGKIPYSKIGHKMFYKLSDIQKILEDPNNPCNTNFKTMKNGTDNKRS